MTSPVCGTDSGATFNKKCNINFFYDSTVQIGDRFSSSFDPFRGLSPNGHIRGHSNLVRDLLNSGQDVSARTYQGVTPLHLAVYDGNMDSLKTILDFDPDVNCATHKHGLTPLHIATALDRKDMVRVLQEHGADRSQRDKDGWLSIHYASESGFARVKRIFERLKSAVPIIKRFHNTAFHPKIDEVRMESLSMTSLESFQSIGQSSLTGSFYSMTSSVKPSPELIRRGQGGAFTQQTATTVTGACPGNCFLSPAMEEIFELFDRSKDGKISMAELTEVIRFLKIPASAEEIEAMVRAVDLNENGVVDYEEFLELVNRHESVLNASSSDLPGVLFDIFDADGNGIIDRGEITRVMLNLGVTITDEDLTEMLREADINGDGQIDKTEFQKLFENLKPSLS